MAGTQENGVPRSRPALLALGALGVVYGDIGTSPLYAIRECFAEGGASATPERVLGVLSLVFWSLIFVVSLKYLAFILRADNQGEGGILALLALAQSRVPRKRRGDRGAVVLVLGLFGAALLYGDGMITPAISVLSAVEGIQVIAPALGPWVLPLTVTILIGLFMVQSLGTAGVGIVFGPATLVWFVVIGTLGVAGILRHPEVLGAVLPSHAVGFLMREGSLGFSILGVVFLVVTGGEALYADMGHFGTRPIRLAWFSVVLPALLLNYFGQGALILHDPTATANPFYRLAPDWALPGVIVVATIATIIASQAMISGAFSLTRQAVQLGYLPRLRILHTSPTEIGQIYLPAVNWLLMIGTLTIVLGFRTSGALAAAYGLAVTTTMVITSLLFWVVARRLWGWSTWLASALVGLFLAFDLTFFAANLVKIGHGGWLPIAILGFSAMTTWSTGRDLVARRIARDRFALADFVGVMAVDAPTRVPGTAVFMTSDVDSTPSALLHNLKHNRVLHERVLVLAVSTEDVPRVPEHERVAVRDLGHGFVQATIRWGFMEDPDVPAALARAEPRLGALVRTPPMETSWFLGRVRPVPGRRPLMPRWREALFAAMVRNARDASDFFGLPPNRVIEMGSQVEI